MKKFLVFLLTAAMIFSVIGCAQPAAEEAPAVEEAPAEPSEEVKLLTEIRDLLSKQN